MTHAPLRARATLRVAMVALLPALLPLSLAGCPANEGEACRCGNDCRSDQCASGRRTLNGGECFRFGQSGICAADGDDSEEPEDIPGYGPTCMPVLDVGPEGPGPGSCPSPRPDGKLDLPMP